MVKLTTLLCAYLQENPQLKYRTVDGKQRAFRYLTYIIGDKMVDRLTVDDCHKFRNTLLSRGLQRSSVNIALRDVASILEWAVTVKQIISANPMKQVKQLKTTRVITTFSNQQFWQLMKDSSLIWQARLLAGRFGLRRAEVLNLIRDDIREDYIFIQPKRRTELTWPWEPKTYECRAVFLPAQLAKLLPQLEFYLMLSKRLYNNSLILQDKGLLTEVRRDCPDPNFNRDFRKLQCRTFGRVVGRFHDLRATFVTSSLEDGVPIHLVKQLAGHRRIETTMTYYSCVRQSFMESQRGVIENGLKKGLPDNGELGQAHMPIQSGSP